MAEFSDSEIRDILKRNGEIIGPITPFTRNIYIKKIKSLMNANTNSQSEGYSDSEIREILKRNGEVIGPITPSTRDIYLKKVASLIKANGIPQNKTSKPPRKSDTEINKNTNKMYLNSSNPIGSKNNIDSENDTASHDKINSRSSFDSSRLSSKVTTYSTNTQPIYSKNIDRTPSRNLSWNSSIDSDFQKIAEDNYRKDQQQKNVSPINYINTNERNLYRWKTSQPVSPMSAYSSPYSKEPQQNANNTKSWYNGSLNTISNYFGSRRRHTDDLMDISDGDMSDTEPGVISRLRKNYFKRSRHRPVSGADSDSDRPSNTVAGHSYRSSLLAMLSPSQLPNLLVLGFAVFAVLMIGSYVLMRAQHSSHHLLDQAIERLVCQPGSLDSLSTPQHCFQATEMPQLRSLLSGLYDVLSRHSGDVKCKLGTAADRRVSFTRARDLLNARLRNSGHADVSSTQWSQLMQLMLALPRDELQLAGYSSEHQLIDDTGLPEHVTYLEGLNPRQSLICRLKLLVLAMLSWVWYAVCVMAALTLATVLAYGANALRLKRKQNHERHVSELREIVSSVSTLLQDQIRQSEYSPSTDPFMPLAKIRAILQQTYPRLREPAFWDQVKRFMYESEPLIELKETLVHGEIVQWKCQPVWQGSAVLSEYQVKFERGPTACLKIRNMDVLKFDENSRNYLRREVMSRIQEPADVKDIRFLAKGTKVIVYVMCASREAAGKAFRQINANYFNGNLLTVKFIRIEKYLERFPDSRIHVK